MGQTLGNYLVPVVFCGILLYGVVRGVPVFDTFIKGAGEGLETAVALLPTLVALVTGVGMLRASGALEAVGNLLAPLAGLLGLPGEVLPLALLRPISGSAATAFFQELLTEFGPDGTIGRVASVLMGSTETTFYTLAVYYGATKVRRTRHSLPASLTGDLIGVVMSGLTVRLLLGG